VARPAPILPRFVSSFFYVPPLPPSPRHFCFLCSVLSSEPFPSFRHPTAFFCFSKQTHPPDFLLSPRSYESFHSFVSAATFTVRLTSTLRSAPFQPIFPCSQLFFRLDRDLRRNLEGYASSRSHSILSFPSYPGGHLFRSGAPSTKNVKSALLSWSSSIANPSACASVVSPPCLTALLFLPPPD